jgi:endonuclease YncB( thermonuclease family)
MSHGCPILPGMGRATAGGARGGGHQVLAAPSVALLVVLVLAAGCTPAASPAADGPGGDLLRLDRPIDGDSFVADDGQEYRVGLINAPEIGACGAAQAAARVRELLADGFTAQPYARDVHGRQVARIATDDGDVGVRLAAEGLADDRYLEPFRHEHRAYAAELDIAFADARAAGAGLWRTCWAADATGLLDPDPEASPGPVVHEGRTGLWACHPAYVHCLPDGPDLDCRDVGHQVVLTGQADPFRLDGNSLTATDGVGCDTFEPWSADADYGYYAGR